jgi:hypothetical protein
MGHSEPARQAVLPFLRQLFEDLQEYVLGKMNSHERSANGAEEDRSRVGGEEVVGAWSSAGDGPESVPLLIVPPASNAPQMMLTRRAARLRLPSFSHISVHTLYASRPSRATSSDEYEAYDPDAVERDADACDVLI